MLVRRDLSLLYNLCGLASSLLSLPACWLFCCVDFASCWSDAVALCLLLVHLDMFRLPLPLVASCFLCFLLLLEAAWTLKNSGVRCSDMGWFAKKRYTLTENGISRLDVVWLDELTTVIRHKKSTRVSFYGETVVATWGKAIKRHALVV